MRYTGGMAFTVSDYQDLLALFREHPEWRAEFTREVLDDEFQRLPALVRQNSADIRELTEIVRQNSADIRDLKEVVAQNSADIRDLKEIVAQNSADIRQNSTDIRELKEAVMGLLQEARGTRNDLGKLKGDNMEFWFRAHPEALVIGRLRKIQVVGIRDLVDLTEAVEDGTLSSEQAHSLAVLDLIVGGREGKGDASVDAYFACEVSHTVDDHDVTRAAERAALLRTLGFNAHPLVAGEVVSDHVRALARQLDVATFVKQPA